MKRFHALVLAASIGAAVGTVLRPGLPEILIVSVLIACAWPPLLKFVIRRSPAAG
jgi:hypothetical protein